MLPYRFDVLVVVELLLMDELRDGVGRRRGCYFEATILLYVFFCFLPNNIKPNLHG